MFGRAFRSKYRACYETCRYRDRIDLLASQLSILKYAEQRICVHVREWLRFTKHCADASIDLPSGICAPEVEDYLSTAVSESRPSPSVREDSPSDLH